MEFEQLIKTVGDEPVFETSFLLSGNADPKDVILQLSRWTKSGRLLQDPTRTLRACTSVPEGETESIPHRKPDGSCILCQLPISTRIPRPDS